MSSTLKNTIIYQEKMLQSSSGTLNVISFVKYSVNRKNLILNSVSDTYFWRVLEW